MDTFHRTLTIDPQANRLRLLTGLIVVIAALATGSTSLAANEAASSLPPDPAPALAPAPDDAARLVASEHAQGIPAEDVPDAAWTS